MTKICVICGNEFETEMARKKYCSRECYWTNNHSNAAYRQRKHLAAKKKRTESADKFPCLKCGLKRNTEKWRFCISCREDIRQFDITDTLAMEHRLIG